ncbi:hypothetical protein GOP47_0029735, partial [Adiantum capillus-veneris]
ACSLPKSTKESIAMKLMGENNVDLMYKRLDEFLRGVQRTSPKQSFDFEKLSEELEALDVLVSWALWTKKLKLREDQEMETGQDEFELL